MDSSTDLQLAQTEAATWRDTLTRLAKLEQYLTDKRTQLRAQYFDAYVGNLKNAHEKNLSELIRTDAEAALIPDLRARAEQKLRAAQSKLTGAVVAELVGMQRDLDRELEAAKLEAWNTKSEADIAHALDLHRGQHTLGLALVNLTRNEQFARQFDLLALAGDSLHIQQRLRILQAPGSRQPPTSRPWEPLLALLQTDTEIETRSAYGNESSREKTDRREGLGPDAA